MHEQFLASCHDIDWVMLPVKRQAALLRAPDGGATETARRCFEFVRDEIAHTGDQQSGPVTRTASEALAARTGFCYSKSHLLAALLRANQIPAALCYQRFEGCLHGLNAVWLPDHGGWYRMDARGNKPGVDAQFCPPREQLAFASPRRDFRRRFAGPLPVVQDALQRHTTCAALEANLPDWAGTPMAAAHNLGPVTRSELIALGFQTVEDLEETGWREVCALWAEAVPGRANLNAFAAVIGAIDECDWRTIDTAKKDEARRLAIRLRRTV